MVSDTPIPMTVFLHTIVIIAPSAILLIRFFPIFSQNQTAIIICLCFGAFIMLLSAVRTLAQSKINNIINYPAAGQLGLIILAIGINLPYLVLFYACIHIILKTILSLCSDLLVHPSDEKDVRNLELQHTLPIITISLGSLVLILAPGIIPFYFKNTLVQVASLSYINLAALLLALMAYVFILTYNIRLIYVLTRPLLKTLKYAHGPKDIQIISPLIFLTSALILTTLFIPPLSAEGCPTSLTTPTYIKAAVFIVLLISIALAHIITICF